MRTRPSGCSRKFPPPSTASQRLAIEIAALCQMTDRMVQARFQDRMKAVEHPEKLTRTELRAKQEENLRLAREGYADRLRKEMAAQSRPLVALDEHRAAIPRRAGGPQSGQGCRRVF